MIAQMEAARAQQAAEAACIGLTLDEEKISSLSASTRRHLQGLALVVQVKPYICRVLFGLLGITLHLRCVDLPRRTLKVRTHTFNC